MNDILIPVITVICVIVGIGMIIWARRDELKHRDVGTPTCLESRDPDNPIKDYGWYKIENPYSDYALRNLPSTNDPVELDKRQVQMKIEIILKRAPSWWYDARRWKEMKLGATIYDSETGKGYVIGTGRELTPKEMIFGPYTEDELKRFTPEELRDQTRNPPGYMVVIVALIGSLAMMFRLLLAWL